MSRRSGVIPSTFRLWTSRILLQRRSAVFSLFGVTVVTLFLLVSPPDFDIRGSVFPRPWGPHIPFEETSGPPGRPVSPPDVWAERAQVVRRAFIHAYGRYESIAFPFDELLPMSNGSMNSINGWGVTAVDSLDTMILMGLKPQAQRVIEHIAKLDFKSAHRSNAPYFETVIRYLGGLLSAYHLTKDHRLLQKADELGTALLPAFNTPSRLPTFQVDTREGSTHSSHWNPGNALLAEIGSCQLEYKFLAKLTGKREYFEVVDYVTSLMEHSQMENGLWNTFWNTTSGEQSNDHLSVGAWADSAYEYLLKEYLLTGQSDKRLLNMYLHSAFGAISNLVFLTPKRQLLYVTDIRNKMITGVFEHLSCFFPGLLALGAYILPADAFSSVHERNLHKAVARGIAHTCYLTYADMPSGLGADEVSMESYVEGRFELGRWMDRVDISQQSSSIPGVSQLAPPLEPTEREARDYVLKSRAYLLRPEVVESMYLMWKTTGEESWRERGWQIFQAIEKNTRTRTAYASVPDVDAHRISRLDTMPSFFLAETLKYLYLLFIKDDPWPLDKYVFNTEAHPLPVFQWTQKEREMWEEFRRTGPSRLWQ